MSLSRSPYSQEVGHNGPVGYGALGFRDRVENVEGALHVLVDVKDGSNVSAAVAVVGC